MSSPSTDLSCDERAGSPKVVPAFTATAGGTGPFTVAAFITGARTPIDKVTYSYFAHTTDKTVWQVGSGHFTAGGTIFVIDTVIANSANTISPLNFPTPPQISPKPAEPPKAIPLTVTVNQAVELSNLGRSTINELIRDKKLHSKTVGRRRLVNYASLMRLVGGEVDEALASVESPSPVKRRPRRPRKLPADMSEHR